MVTASLGSILFSGCLLQLLKTVCDCSAVIFMPHIASFSASFLLTPHRAISCRCHQTLSAWCLIPLLTCYNHSVLGEYMFVLYSYTCVWAVQQNKHFVRFTQYINELFIKII